MRNTIPPVTTLSLFLAATIALLGCGDSTPATPAAGIYPLPEEPPELLSDWNLFLDLPARVPAEGVLSYEVISPLFSDFAIKDRFFVIPPDSTIGYDDVGEWAFPVGAVLIKTFRYNEDDRDPSQGGRVLETRLLVHEADGWEPHTYVWNEEQTDAERVRAGRTIPISFIDETGETIATDYVVPNTNECRECHGENELLDTLGGVSRNLDLDHDFGDGLENQIAHFAGLGLFDVEPPAYEERTRLVDPVGDAPLSDRARSYLDVNCAMCHRDTSAATQSELYLDWWSTDPALEDPTAYGVCKIPTSAGGANCGLTFDIVPGHPETSIMSCRVRSVDPQVQMPPLGRTLAHEQGADLLDAWIAALPPASCTP